MGIRDYLREWVTPYDAQAGWKVGDTAVTTQERAYGRFMVPAGVTVVIDSVPEARHGADPYALSSFTWGEHKHCEASLSPETARHHFGTDEPCVRRPT